MNVALSHALTAMSLITNFDLSLSPGHSDSPDSRPDENHNMAGREFTVIFAIGIMLYIKARETTAIRRSRLSCP